MVKEERNPHLSLDLTNPQLAAVRLMVAVARPTATIAVVAMVTAAETAVVIAIAAVMVTVATIVVVENPENSPQQSFFLLYSARR
jgi:hypothetical protein